MPAPPPNGASSTVRWTSVVASRRSCTRRSMNDRSCARPNRLADANDVTMSGKIVRTSIRTAIRSARTAVEQLEQAVGSVDRDNALGRAVDHEHDGHEVA